MKLKIWNFAIFLLAVLIFGIIWNLDFFKSKGDSMIGVIDEGKWIVGLRTGIPFNTIKRGDIVIFDFNTGAGDTTISAIKEVAGIPSDTCYVVTLFEKYKKFVLTNKGYEKTFYNNTESETFYETFNSSMYYRKEDLTISKLVLQDQFFVLGSNVDGSLDSRRFGLLDRENIKNKVIAVL